MKRTHEVKSVFESFKYWLKENQYEEKSTGILIKENWKEIAGATIYNHTSSISVSPPKIYLKIDNSTLKEMLYQDKKLLIDKVNDYAHQKLIEDIIFT